MGLILMHKTKHRLDVLSNTTDRGGEDTTKPISEDVFTYGLFNDAVSG
jgi:hypothetical protein